MPFLEYISETANYPPAPDGITIYAIGDIHGRLDLLKNVHQQIDQDKSLRKPKQSVEVYLGDYIDRGPDSAGVVSHLIARGRDAHTIFLRGNHEQYLLDFLQGAECWEQWKDIGAIPSVLSYGLAPALLSRDTAQEGIRRALAQRLPRGARPVLWRYRTLSRSRAVSSRARRPAARDQAAAPGDR